MGLHQTADRKRPTPPGAKGKARRPKRGLLVQIDGRPVHVLCQGRGEPVLLLHGNGGLGEEILAPFAHRRGIRWIAPDRPGYGYSAPLRAGGGDPLAQARWVLALIARLGLPPPHVVAHSIAAGVALCLASSFPYRLRSLTLVAPFCRPTPHRWMPGLRLAVAPAVGPLVRAVLPAAVPLVRQRVLHDLSAPNPVPRSVRALPMRHMVQPKAVKTIAAELRAFNAGMRAADPWVSDAVPVVALFGALDRTAEPDWHRPWLMERVSRLSHLTLPEVGHMLHHLRPDAVWEALLRVMAESGDREAPARESPAG